MDRSESRVVYLASITTKPEDPVTLSKSSKSQTPEVNSVIFERDLSGSFHRTLLVFFTLVLLGITFYLAFYFWKKNKQRPIPTLYKLEGYRYSRLNQNELDVDSSVVIYSDGFERNQSEVDLPNIDENQCKPATLHVETDSLINISNCTLTASGIDILGLNNFQESSKLMTLEEVSDEDLLQ